MCIHKYDVYINIPVCIYINKCLHIMQKIEDFQDSLFCDKVNKIVRIILVYPSFRKTARSESKIIYAHTHTLPNTRAHSHIYIYIYIYILEIGIFDGNLQAIKKVRIMVRRDCILYFLFSIRPGQRFQY